MDAKAFFALDIRRAIRASAVSPLLCDNLSCTNKTIAVGCENSKKILQLNGIRCNTIQKTLGKYIKTLTEIMILRIQVIKTFFS